MLLQIKKYWLLGTFLTALAGIGVLLYTNIQLKLEASEKRIELLTQQSEDLKEQVELLSFTQTLNSSLSREHRGVIATYKQLDMSLGETVEGIKNDLILQEEAKDSVPSPVTPLSPTSRQLLKSGIQDRVQSD